MNAGGNNDLLVEVGTEELPAGAQRPLARALAQNLARALGECGCQPGRGESFCTPRRLSVRLGEMACAEPDHVRERKGPSVLAAFDTQGRPTRAAEGFARSAGVAVETLETRRTPKGEWLVHRRREAGRPLAEVLLATLPGVLTGLPLGRRMRWGSGDAEFLRPVRWLLVRLGNRTLPVEAFGLRAGGHSYGHRFHHPQPVDVKTPGAYEKALRAANVMAAPRERLANVTRQVEQLARRCGGRPAAPSELFEEICGMVEWPVAVAGEFDAQYLALPEPVLVTTLARHQRFIPVRGADARLMSRFIAVMNLDSSDPQQLREGLEKVVRPRLADAEFYYRRDRRRPLSAYARELAGMAFGKKLGSLADKALRLEKLAGRLAEALGMDAESAARAGLLSKCDLATGMVFEFPELQGLMGGHYATEDGENEEVAAAISEQYAPAGASGALPRTPHGAILAMADRLDTLVGGFAAGREPTGARDPFGLRRAAFGVLRIAAESAPGLDLDTWLETAARGYPDNVHARASLAALSDFVRERLRSVLRENNLAPDVIQAVLGVSPLKPAEALARAKAVAGFCQRPEARALAAANKRIANILRQAGGARADSGATTVRDPEERRLAEAVHDSAARLERALSERDFDAALLTLSTLREPVDRFFDKVLVMAPDPAVRARRLELLASLRKMFLNIADIGELQGTRTQ